MKVFVTGGSGDVGEAVLRHLSLSGHECRVLSREAEAHRRRLTAIPGVYPVRGDVTAATVDQLAGLMSKCEAVVHLVGVIVEKGTAGFEAVHVEGARRVAAAAEKAAAGLARMGLRGGRRPYRARLQELEIRREGEDLRLGFVLPPGAYATEVLREAVKAEPPLGARLGWLGSPQGEAGA